jgi:hypothetical protein
MACLAMYRLLVYGVIIVHGSIIEINVSRLIQFYCILVSDTCLDYYSYLGMEH